MAYSTFKACTLMVHSTSHNTEELLLNPELFRDIAVGDFVQIFEPEKSNDRLYLKIKQAPVNIGRMELSLSKGIAEALNLRPFSKVMVGKLHSEDVTLDFVELSFKRQYLQRGNIWWFQKAMMGRSIYINQNLCVNGVQAQIQDVRRDGQTRMSGIVSAKTKFVFRSKSARLIWLVQISAEMWGIDQNGDLYFEKFLNDFVSPLLDRWLSLGVSHKLSVIFFARTLYFERVGMEQNADLFSKKSLNLTSDGVQYQDFFKVVIENVAEFDKVSMLQVLRREFWAFPLNLKWRLPHAAMPRHWRTQEASAAADGDTATPEDTGTNNPVKYAVPSDAVHGNFLEAINVSLNVLSRHYMDRDLQRTNNSIVMVSAGSGVFKVKPHLAQITEQRMLDNAIGLDFISLSRPSVVNSVPLFLVDCSTEGVKSFYEMPHWIRVSYIDCKKDIRDRLDCAYLDGDDDFEGIVIRDTTNLDDLKGEVGSGYATSIDAMWVKHFVPLPCCGCSLTALLMNSNNPRELLLPYSRTLPVTLRKLLFCSAIPLTSKNGQLQVTSIHSPVAHQHSFSLSSLTMELAEKEVGHPTFWGEDAGDFFPSWGWMDLSAVQSPITRSLVPEEDITSRRVESRMVFSRYEAVDLKAVMSGAAEALDRNSKDGKDSSTNRNPDSRSRSSTLTSVGAGVVDTDTKGSKHPLTNMLEQMPVINRDRAESVSGSYGSTLGDVVDEEGQQPGTSLGGLMRMQANTFKVGSPSADKLVSVLSASNPSQETLQQHLTLRGHDSATPHPRRGSTTGPADTSAYVRDLNLRQTILQELGKAGTSKDSLKQLMRLHDNNIFRARVCMPDRHSSDAELVESLLGVNSDEADTQNEPPLPENALSTIQEGRIVDWQSGRAGEEAHSTEDRTTTQVVAVVMSADNHVSMLGRTPTRSNINDRKPYSTQQTEHIGRDKHTGLDPRNEVQADKSVAASGEKEPHLQPNDQQATKGKDATKSVNPNSSKYPMNKQMQAYMANRRGWAGRMTPQLASKLSSKDFVIKHGQIVPVGPGGANISSSGTLDTTKEAWEERRAAVQAYSDIHRLNPFRRKEGEKYMFSINHNRRRWSHVFPSDKLERQVDYGLNWKSLTEPAILPLATDYLPNAAGIMSGYEITSEYRLLDERSTSRGGVIDLLHELVFQRLSQEFQLVTDIDMTQYYQMCGFAPMGASPASRLGSRSALGGASSVMSDRQYFFILSMGHRIHFLWYDSLSKQINVKLFRSKKGKSKDEELPQPMQRQQSKSQLGENDLEKYTYRYETWVDSAQTFRTMTQTFFKFPNPEFKWNKYDYIINGSLEPPDFDPPDESFRLKRLKFCVIPPRIFTRAALEEYFALLDQLTEFLGKYVPPGAVPMQMVKEQSLVEPCFLDQFSTSHTVNTTNSTDTTAVKGSVSKEDHEPFDCFNRLMSIYRKTAVGASELTLEMKSKDSGEDTRVNTVFLKHDQVVSSYKVLHLDFYWLACYSWLLEDFFTILYRRCQKWGLRLCRVPEYSNTNNLVLHPFRPIPYISVHRDHREVPKTLPSPIRLIERIYFNRSGGWVFDGKYPTDWSALGIAQPNYPDRDRDILQQTSTTQPTGQQQVEGEMKPQPQSALSKSLGNFPFFQRQSSTSATGVTADDDGLNSSLAQPQQVPSFSTGRSRKLLDRQYTHESGLLQIRLGGQGFLWIRNGSTRVSEAGSLNAEERQSFLTRESARLESFCVSAVDCYEILLDVIDRALLQAIDLVELVCEISDSAVSQSEEKTAAITTPPPALVVEVVTAGSVVEPPSIPGDHGLDRSNPTSPKAHRESVPAMPFISIGESSQSRHSSCSSTPRSQTPLVSPLATHAAFNGPRNSRQNSRDAVEEAA